jgi:hypothetical protein
MDCVCVRKIIESKNMREGIPEETFVAPLSPEESEPPELGKFEMEVNLEGNETELLISRLRNPVIKRQIAEIVYQKKINYYSSLKNEEWEQYLPEGWTGDERFKLLKGKHGGRIISTEDLETELKCAEAPVTIEEMEKEIEKDIDEVASITEISYTADGPNSSVISLNWIVPWTGERVTSKQLSVFEAHEKGHKIRHYDALTKRFREGFDILKVQFTHADYELFKNDTANHANKSGGHERELSLEEKREEYLNGYLFTGMEIAERMSQLKNYFGFKGDEKFTKEHLDYAKEHYIRDTNMDNGMRMFFEGITAETENTFLELINNFGI